MTVTANPCSVCSAIAPPARQTKSAECALTTSAVLPALLLATSSSPPNAVVLSPRTCHRSSPLW